MTASSGGSSWEIVPESPAAGLVLALLFLYLLFRHTLFVFMIMELIIGWLRQFRWFPKKGKRVRTFVHWLIALGLFGAYITIAGAAGWLEFIPQ